MGRYCDKCKKDAKDLRLFEAIKRVNFYSVEDDVDGVHSIDKELCKNCRMELRKLFLGWLKNDGQK